MLGLRQFHCIWYVSGRELSVHSISIKRVANSSNDALAFPSVFLRHPLALATIRQKTAPPGCPF